MEDKRTYEKIKEKLYCGNFRYLHECSTLRWRFKADLTDGNRFDTACVESRQPDGSVIAIDTLAVERAFVETRLDRRELDYLICNDPAAYAELVLCGDVKAYLDAVRQGQ